MCLQAPYSQLSQRRSVVLGEASSVAGPPGTPASAPPYRAQCIHSWRGDWEATSSSLSTALSSWSTTKWATFTFTLKL